MNAPAKIRSARDDYIPQVRRFVPGCRGRELELRCSLLLSRDQAASAAQRCSREAEGILEHILWLVDEHAFRRMPLDRLEEVREHVVRLVCCASGLESFAFRLAFPGGRNEGG